MSPDPVTIEPPPDSPTRWKVLYFEQAPWKVGERDTDRKARIKAADAVELRDLYPGTGPGQVISVIPAHREYTPANLVDPSRAVVTLDLAAEDLAALRSRSCRIGANHRPTAVTFDQKHGAVAPELKRRFPLDFLAREAEEEAERVAVEERNLQAETDWQADVELWRDSLAEAVELGAVFETPTPARPALEPLPEPEFALTATKLGRLLPPTLVHSGAGLYKVQAAGDMATPAHLWAMEEVDPPDDGDPGGNPGTGSNVTVGPGEIGHALDFNGTNSNVNVGDVAELNSAQKWTICFRMNQAVLDAVDNIFVKELDATHKIQIYTAPNFQMWISDGVNAYGYFDYSTVVGALAWHHVAWVFDGSQTGNANRLRCYIDGNPMTLTFSGTIPAASANLAGSGAYIGYTSGAFDGLIDDFRIYADDALTETEIKDIAGRGVTHYDTIVSAVKDNGTTTITLTTGVARDFTGEVFESGGNGYAIQSKTDDTHLVVVGDASAESGACTISPYTTIQSALDQLWTDQGAATFTASQYIRVFAGTYDESPTPNAALDTDEANGFVPILEGDPTDDRANMLVAPTAANGIYFNCDYLIVRHLKVVTVAGGAYHGVSTGTGILGGQVLDCQIETGNVNAYGVNLRTGLQMRDTTIVSALGHGAAMVFGRDSHIVNCVIRAARLGIQVGSDSVIVESTVVAGASLGGVTLNVNGPSATVILRNNTFYDCTPAINLSGSNRMSYIYCDLTDNVFKDCAQAIKVDTAVWPEETATRWGPSFTLRNNCYHGYTNFATDGTDTKTYAEFTAYGNVDASGDLDDTDPLLTAPATGDFSLQTASPCWDTGHGSGVTTDYLGSVLDPAHPPIGAWSPGALVKTPPTMSVAVAGTTITATLSGSSHRYRTRLSTAAGVEISESSRAGAGDVAFAGNTEGTHYRLQAWAVTADDAVALGEPSIIHDAYVANASAQTASGPISLPIENLRILLSNADDFQALVGAGDAAGALGSIHYPYQDADEYVRPCALLEGAESWNSRQPAIETVQIFLHDGEMAVTIERDVDAAYQAGGKERDAYLTFTNTVGAIVSDLESGAISYLDVRAIRIVEKPRRVARTEKAQGRDYYSTTLAVEWGG